MLQSNPNFERAGFPERPAGSSATSSFSAPPPARAEDTEATRIPVLGKTLLFRGELTAEEDVILQGRVEGSIRHARNLIIGPEGSVLGDVYASHLTVEGLVEGDLHCSEAVVVRATAQVRGNIFAPRVGIMEGATFNGRVEMDPGAATGQGGGGRAAGSRQSAAAARTPAAPPNTPTRASAPGGNASVRSGAAGPVTQSAATPLSSSAVDQVLNAPSPAKK